MLVAHDDWSYARIHGDEIDDHWQRASAENPRYFNGDIHLIESLEVGGNRITARLFRTDFKSFLFWRNAGFPVEANAFDGFGSALIRSIEGYILLGRQRASQINAGLSYLPGGFLDARDVGADGKIDILASIAREVLEETGLSPTDLNAAPGIIVTHVGPHVSFAQEFRTDLTAHALTEKVHAHLASEADPELESIVVVRGVDDFRNLAMPPYAGCC